jgi:hypothetical protein
MYDKNCKMSKLVQKYGLKNCTKLLSKSCLKIVIKLSKNCQKVFIKLSKSWQKVSKIDL